MEGNGKSKFKEMSRKAGEGLGLKKIPRILGMVKTTCEKMERTG